MDRRTVWAILLMMVIAVAPALFLKKPAPRPAGPADSLSVASDTSPAPAGADRPAVTARDTVPSAADSSAPAPSAGAPVGEDTVRVTSPLYTYGISTRGARLVQAELRRYASMAPGEEQRRAQILPKGSALLGLTVVRGRDTIDFREATFTPSAENLAVSGEDAAPAQRRAGRRAAGPDLYLRAGRLPGERVGEGLRRRPQRRRAAGGHGPHHRQHRSEHRGEPPGPRAGHQAGRHRAHRFRQPGAGRAPGPQRPLSVGRRQVQVLRDRIDRRRLQRRPDQRRHGHCPPRLRGAHLRGHPAQHAIAAERRRRLHGLCRPHGVRAPREGGSRLRRRQPLRLARLPDHHPGLRGRRSAGCSSGCTRTCTWPTGWCWWCSGSWSGWSSGRSTRRPCAPT